MHFPAEPQGDIIPTGDEDTQTRALGAALLVLLGAACTTLPPPAARGPAKGPASEANFPGTRCCDVSDVRFYFTGDVFLERVEQLIRNARDYILIDSFLVSDDEKGRYVFELLRQKQLENVRVYILTDSSTAFVPARTGVPYLVENGVPVTEFNPMRGSRLARFPLFVFRDHRKFWLIDGETVVLGGQNIWSISLDPPDSGGNTDSMVEFRSAVACRELLNAYVREWNAYSLDKLSAGNFVVRPRPPGGCLWLLNQERNRDRLAGRMFASLLDAAEREVWLIQDYTMPDRSVLARIRALSARGVEVNILFSTAYSHLDKFHYATGYRKRDLLRAGARLWEYGHPLSHLHYKGVIVDERWFGIGSMNLNFRTAHLSKELNVVIEGRELAEPMLENLAQLRARARPITREQADGYRGGKYLFYYLLLFLGG